MQRSRRQERDTVRGPRRLAGLARDTAGNTLAMMAAAMIPVTALAGSAIDSARMYVVKVRLQQACDAGVLAGRKFMTSSSATALDAPAVTQANAFFTNNFKTGWMQTKQVVFTPTKTADQQVAGTATATVPMSIMKMFAAADVQLNVVCEARFDVADTDIVFVLDTTGSMACAPSDSSSACSSYVNGAGTETYTRPANSSTHQTAGYASTTGYSVPEKSDSRIGALRTAVKNFYDTMASNVDPTTNIRYGFVTYASAVNAGAAIMAASPAHMVGGSGSGQATADYQSRQLPPTGTYEYLIATSAVSYNAKTQANCTAASVRTPTTARTFNTNGQSTYLDEAWYPSANPARCGNVTRTMGPQWIHRVVAQNVVNYVAGNSVQDPTKVVTANNRWLGCIEERDTNPGQSNFTPTTLPADLNPTLIPSSAATRWRPMWPQVTYARNQKIGYAQYSNGQWYGYYYFDGNGEDIVNGDVEAEAPWYGTQSKETSGNVACGKPIRRLAAMTEAQVDGFVDADDFAPLGGTYHDFGMIWGTRLLAKDGIFAADTVAHPGRNDPKRVIIFLTDGDMAPAQNSYGLYGIEYFWRRITDGDFGDIKDYHNKRFLAACEAAKGPLNIDVWTVAIGLDSTTELKACATTEAQALETTSGAGLSTAFEKIAKQVAMLRVSK